MYKIEKIVVGLVLTVVLAGCHTHEDSRQACLDQDRLKIASWGSEMLTQSSHVDQQSASEQIEITYFWAPWSSQSRLYLPELGKLANEFPKRLVINSINIDHTSQWAGKWNVTNVPCLLYSRRDQPVQRRTDFHSAKELRQFIISELESS